MSGRILAVIALLIIVLALSCGKKLASGVDNSLRRVTVAEPCLQAAYCWKADCPVECFLDGDRVEAGEDGPVAQDDLGSLGHFADNDKRRPKYCGFFLHAAGVGHHS